MGDSVFNQLSRQGDLGAKLLVQGAKSRLRLNLRPDKRKKMDEA